MVELQRRFVANQERAIAQQEKSVALQADAVERQRTALRKAWILIVILAVAAVLTLVLPLLRLV